MFRTRARAGCDCKEEMGYAKATTPTPVPKTMRRKHRYNSNNLRFTSNLLPRAYFVSLLVASILVRPILVLAGDAQCTSKDYQW